MDRIKDQIFRRSFYGGRLCPVCLAILYYPPEQSYVPQHKMEDCYGKFTDWCIGSFGNWREPHQNRLVKPGPVDTRKK